MNKKLLAIKPIVLKIYNNDVYLLIPFLEYLP